MSTEWVERTIQGQIERHLKRGKSVLLLGPRQTGKSSCLNRLRWDLEISFLIQRTRLEYEQDPDRLIKEVEAIKTKVPRILIDEVQKVPSIMDVVQYLVDK